MYQVKLALTEEEILEFENLRNKVFNGTQPIVKKTQSPYAKAIEAGDLLAFRCLKDEELVGGMLVGLQGNNLDILRLFVEKSHREQGAGSYMITYLDSKKVLLEDYYGVKLEGVYISPMPSNVDYCFERGFGSAGSQMYKQYTKKGRK